MLVLSRRISEKIVFPSFNITVHLLQAKRGMACLGIEAPPEVLVLRQEVVACDGKGAMETESSRCHLRETTGV